MMVRKDTRFSVRSPVTYVLEDAACQGTTFNLSRGGCAIESDAMASEGESVSLQFMAPDQPTAYVWNSGGCAGRPGGNLELNSWSFWKTRNND